MLQVDRFSSYKDIRRKAFFTMATLLILLLENELCYISNFLISETVLPRVASAYIFIYGMRVVFRNMINTTQKFLLSIGVYLHSSYRLSNCYKIRKDRLKS